MRISRHQVVALLEETPSVPQLGAGSEASCARLGEAERDELTRWARGATTPQRVVVRSIIVLLSDGGWSNARVAAALGVSRRTVALWKARFAARGAQGLLVDEPGRGRKPGRNRQTVERIMAMTSQRPLDGRRWTVRSLARAVGASHATVQRVWREHDIRPFFTADHQRK